MKQLISFFRDGKTSVVDTPYPNLRDGHVIIQTAYSLISSGTEKMLVNFGKSSMLNKARSEPDRVREVLNKIKTDGVSNTVSAINFKMSMPIPLGYCNVGKVIEVGKGISDLKVGDNVVSNGPHAEVVIVPKQLCAKVPVLIPLQNAPFAIVGAIALHGIRLASPALGENYIVYGLGLIGQLACQILKANGCNVIGIDIDDNRCSLAEKHGIKAINSIKGDFENDVSSLTDGIGFDGAIITASSKNEELIRSASRVCRQKGKIILIGVCPINIDRNLFYKKELIFQVSCSYGPGRYDENYENLGIDYPVAYVRWTENRNFQAILKLISNKSLFVNDLISEIIQLDSAPHAYEKLSDSKILSILIKYPQTKLGSEQQTIKISMAPSDSPDSSKPVVGFIGAGNYASRVLLPCMKNHDVYFKTIASQGGLSGTFIGKKYGFRFSTTDLNNIFTDPEINTVVIATRHDSHSDLVCQAIAHNKNIFVEKPIAITADQISRIKSCIEHYNYNRILMVGFNRRFSPHIRAFKEVMDGANCPKNFVYTVNAGFIPEDHWTQDPLTGGGRIIGEGCHFVDLVRFLAGSPIGCFTSSFGTASDICTIALDFENGSKGHIHYLSNGNKSFPKERLEIFFSGKILQLIDFKKVCCYGIEPKVSRNLFRSDKGQDYCLGSFFRAVSNGDESPIPLNEIFETSSVIIGCAQPKG